MNRRAVLKGAVAVALPLPSAALALQPTLTPDAQIAYHADALRKLIRPRLPGDIAGMTIEVRQPEPGSLTTAAVSAQYWREQWQDDPRSLNGGRMTVSGYGVWGLTCS